MIEPAKVCSRSCDIRNWGEIEDLNRFIPKDAKEENNKSAYLLKSNPEIDGNEESKEIIFYKACNKKKAQFQKCTSSTRKIEEDEEVTQTQRRHCKVTDIEIEDPYSKPKLKAFEEPFSLKLRFKPPSMSSTRLFSYYLSLNIFNNLYEEIIERTERSQPKKRRMAIRCKCGSVAVIRTSWSKANPRKLYYACLIKDKGILPRCFDTNTMGCSRIIVQCDIIPNFLDAVQEILMACRNLDVFLNFTIIMSTFLAIPMPSICTLTYIDFDPPPPPPPPPPPTETRMRELRIFAYLPKKFIRIRKVVDYIRGVQNYLFISSTCDEQRRNSTELHRRRHHHHHHHHHHQHHHGAVDSTEFCRISYSRQEEVVFEEHEDHHHHHHHHHHPVSSFSNDKLG
ncbi:hypothetical protein LXL04_018229 [Taraxacum kok-saghyz]